jgi:hypothetical protein
MLRARNRDNGRAILSRWNAAPLLTGTRQGAYRRLSSAQAPDVARVLHSRATED